MKMTHTNTTTCSANCKGCFRKNILNQYLHKGVNALSLAIIFLLPLIRLAYGQDPGLNFQNQPVYEPDTAMRWENKPGVFNVAGESVTMRTNGEQYLWGDSHEFDFDFPYSHFYYRNISGDFTAVTTVLLTSDWNYGNAGLLIKLSESNWIKLYVAKEMNTIRLNTVYTADAFHFDYHTIPIQTESSKIRLMVSCNNGKILLKYSINGVTYETVRMLDITVNYKSAQAGLMADSPMSIGFDASFENSRVWNKSENQ